MGFPDKLVSWLQDAFELEFDLVFQRLSGHLPFELSQPCRKNNLPFTILRLVGMIFQITKVVCRTRPISASNDLIVSLDTWMVQFFSKMKERIDVNDPDQHLEAFKEHDGAWPNVLFNLSQYKALFVVC